MNEFEYKFSLWQFDVVTDFNRTTQLVRNRSTGRLMVKKIMPAYEFEVHNAVSKINNCHIAKVFDVITDRNACIILEEYVQGHTIEQYLSKGTFAEDYAINIARQICNGLSVLHKYSITHRDITPSNIIIGFDGVVKIIDFGISRLHKENAKHDTQVLGTEGYAAPEQFGFKQSDCKTDIYALGVLLNYMLTGHIPSEVMYRDGDVADIIKKCTEYEMVATTSVGIIINGRIVSSDSHGYIKKDDELYKEDVILVKLKNDFYVELEKLNLLLKLKAQTSARKGYKINEFMMLTSPSAVGDLFVDEKSLKPYYGMEDKSAKVLMRKLKNNK